MDYISFVNNAKEDDERNTFGRFAGDISFAPDELRPFYQSADPIDVEVGYNGVSIRFCPAAELTGLQEEYASMNVGFVFATCNGDPIFLNAGKVYTSAHGAGESEWELMAESFDGFLDVIKGDGQ